MKVAYPKIWLSFKICGICFAITLAVYTVVSILENNGTILIFGNIISVDILDFCLSLMCTLFGVTLTLLLFSFDKTKLVGVLTLGLLVPLCVIMSLITLYFNPDRDSITLTSPDCQHEIVVIEHSFLFGCWGGFYEKTSSCTMELLGQYGTDDFCVLNIENYEINWQADGFEFEYYYGNGVYKTESVKYLNAEK